MARWVALPQYNTKYSCSPRCLCSWSSVQSSSVWSGVWPLDLRGHIREVRSASYPRTKSPCLPGMWFSCWCTQPVFLSIQCQNGANRMSCWQTSYEAISSIWLAYSLLFFMDPSSSTQSHAISPLLGWLEDFYSFAFVAS